MQVRIDHRTKAISFGLDLHVAHKEEVPEGPYLQVLYDLQRNSHNRFIGCHWFGLVPGELK